MHTLHEQRHALQSQAGEGRGRTLLSRQSWPMRSRTCVELLTTTMRSPLERRRASMAASTAILPLSACQPGGSAPRHRPARPSSKSPGGKNWSQS